jgi:predicted Zn-dependent protease
MSPFFGPNRPRTGCNPRLIVAAAIALFSLISYFSMKQVNPTTGQVQHISMSPRQETALGLQAAPSMLRQYGGESQDAQAAARVRAVGAALVATPTVQKSPYRYQFHLLADPRTINAFALPGGQVFITEALYRKLTTEGQLAGVLGHEVGHVIERHSAEQLAQSQLTQGLTGAAVIAAYDPDRPGTQATAAVAMAIGQLVNLRFSRTDELEADGWGVKLSAEAGYDPRSMIDVMHVLEEASKGGHTPEFFSTHPNPQNRIPRIEAAIQKLYPSGVPDTLKK